MKVAKKYLRPVLLPGVNFINMFTHSFFTRKTKKLLIFENEFQHAFLYENCAVCAIRKSHLAVLVVQVTIRKSQLAVHKIKL
jgi:hypothetical protein